MPRSPETRIAALFLRGFSLDLISELGLSQGWTRHAAKNVVASKGWALDWSGRLQPEFLTLTVVQDGYVSIVEAAPERMISVAIDHERAAVRAAARRCQAGIDELRAVLLQEEEADMAVAARRAAMKSVIEVRNPSEAAGQDQQASGCGGTDRGLKGPQRPVQRAGEGSYAKGSGRF